MQQSLATIGGINPKAPIDSKLVVDTPNESSRKVTEKRADCKGPDSVPPLEIHPQVGSSVDAPYAAPTTSGEALQLAI